jgi:hypothetical protein
MPPLRLILCFLFGVLSATAAETPKTHFDYRREAVAAHQRQDYPAMAAACEAALHLRPDSPRYLFNLALAQILLQQTDKALDTLRRLAALGVSMSVEKTPDFAPLQTLPAYAAILARFAANRAPQGEAKTLHELAGTTGILEGLAWRKATGDLFLGDVHSRCVWRLEPNGTLSKFSAPPELYGVFGLAVDEARGALWLATTAGPEMSGYTEADKGRAGLAELDLTTGALRRLLPVPATGEDHLISDLTLAADGTIYLTDSATPLIWHLPPDATQLAVFCTLPSSTSLQGLALVNRGKTLLISDYANGLFTIDLLDRAVRPLSPPPDVTLLGIDGLLAKNRTIVAVQNGINPQRLVRFTLSPDSRSIAEFTVLAANLPDMDDLTLSTLIDGQPAFISNSGWSKFAGAKEPPPPHTGRIMQLPLP